MYARAKQEFGRIDVLFNNAGINPTDDTSVLETSLEAWQRVQDVNLRSVFLCCKHGIPHLQRRRRQAAGHRRYKGGDIVLPGDPSVVIRESENPELRRQRREDDRHEPTAQRFSAPTTRPASRSS